ncbi:hypothetical protein [Providencia sp. PROV089]|uniref:hypothetical protein n=1 Tax=Providencia sp. PROV089 TaxID=2949805 RepID=UPI0023497E19|nr:hypothetical protein [Providencia sp. PROV089]
MNLKRLFAVKQPCKNCPFLKDTGIVLSEGRLESIKNDLLADDMGSFHCHETTFSTGGYYEEAEDGESRTYHMSGKESFCAGAMGWLLLKRQPNIAMRLGHAMGYIDLNELETITDLIR